MLRDRAGDDDVNAPALGRPAGVQLRARRSPRLVALGVLCVVLGALGAAALYAMGNDQQQAVIMSRDVVRGQQITGDDVVLAALPAGAAIEFIAAESAGQVVGQTALTDLPAGSFPAARHLGVAPIPPGHSLVGLQLGPGRMPGSELFPGSAVQLVSLEEGKSSATDAVVAQAPAITDDGSGFVMDVIVADDAAHEVARLAATQQLALVAVGER